MCVPMGDYSMALFRLEIVVLSLSRFLSDDDMAVSSGKKDAYRIQCFESDRSAFIH